MKRRTFTIGWLVWAAAFVVWETLAILDPATGDTLSEHVWALLDGGWARYFLLGGPFIWLGIHFFWKGKHG